MIMSMKMKVVIGIGALCLGIVLSLFITTSLDRQGAEQSTAVADQFINLLYSPVRPQPSAYGLVSDGFRAVQSENVTLKMRDSVEKLIGKYVSHGKGADVTKVLAPNTALGEPIKIIKFDIVYENDPDGSILVTMIHERGKWKVLGFNISSPLITEAQMTGSLPKPAPATGEKQSAQGGI